MKRRILGWAALGWMGFAAGCDGRNVCMPADEGSCPKDQVCEQVQGSDVHSCFPPVEVHGSVSEVSDGAPIAGAFVIALDQDGAPVSAGAASISDGRFRLRIPSERIDSDGAFVPRTVRLTAAAKNHARFPGGIRVGAPISTEGAVSSGEGRPWVMEGIATSLVLELLPEHERDLPALGGEVELNDAQLGALVVSERPGFEARAGVADARGVFRLFNLAPGTWSVRVFSKGANYAPLSVAAIPGINATGYMLRRSSGEAAKLEGKVRIGDTGGSSSVVLAVKSTYQAALVRGQVPPGFRVAVQAQASEVNTQFSFEGVPDGQYIALAGFDNDGWVRDPDPAYASASAQQVTVSGGSVTSGSLQPFRLVAAVEILAPGGEGGVGIANLEPTFTWKSHPRAASYQVVVLNAAGETVWSSPGISLSDNPSLAYAGPVLEEGQVYQWRVTARSNTGIPVSRSEELKGVFRVAP